MISAAITYSAVVFRAEGDIMVIWLDVSRAAKSGAEDGMTDDMEVQVAAEQADRLVFEATGAQPDWPTKDGPDRERAFRFFDNRQKYLMFVNTCSEKWVIAQRVCMELGNLHPQPPALRIFDAGMGDGTVLTRVMRAAHSRFAHMPFYIVGKEISLEDVRLTLEKMPDRFMEHPATMLVMTNLYYSEAPG